MSIEMSQEPVNFRATIVDGTIVPPVSETMPDIPEPLPISEPLPDCCNAKKESVEESFESFVREPSELADALPTIFIGVGVAYVIGVLTGAVIFSSPSVEF